MEFDFTFGGRTPRARPRRADDDRGPFRLLLIADFSGRASRRARGESTPLGRPVAIDAAVPERAFAACRVTLPIGAPGEEEVATFGSLDDLHPDALFARLQAFAEPRRLRAALAAPGAGGDALDAAERWLARHIEQAGGAPARDASAVAPARPAALPSADDGPTPPESADSTVERLLGRAPSSSGARPTPAAAGPVTAASAMHSLIESVIRPHVTPDAGPRREQLLLALDEALTTRMRAILAAPDFRALEGAWRAALRVVRTLDTDSDLHIALFDACKEELREAVSAGRGDLEVSPLHGLLVRDDQAWSLVAADLVFDRTEDDLRLCAALGALAARAGGALIAGAAPALLGCDTLEGLREPSTWRAEDGHAPEGQLWRALRESRLAPSIALALPRVLARLPYGKKADPIDAFPFEELPGSGDRPPLLRVWGPAAFAAAEVLGAAFRAEGWAMEAPVQGILDDLPTHTFDDGGESRLVPCAEVGLGERAGAAIATRGLTAILAERDRGAVRVMGPSSIASPAAALDGPWAHAR